MEKGRIDRPCRNNLKRARPLPHGSYITMSDVRRLMYEVNRWKMAEVIWKKSELMDEVISRPSVVLAICALQE